MYKTGGEEMISCPYNPYHVVKKIRIQKHILKCKKNYPEVNLVTCVYNYSHKLKPENLLEHYEICRQKVRLEGSRYCDAGDDSSVSSVQNYKLITTPFPDINCKARILPEPEVPAQMDDSVSQQLDSSSESEMPELESALRGRFYEHDKDNDSYVEPLPIPKTVSKAFVCKQKEPEKSELTETSSPKGFGRGKNFKLFLSQKPQMTDSLPPLVNTAKYSVGEMECSWFNSDNDSCNQSVRSSMFEDTSTLKSMECIYSDTNVDCLLKGLDKYVKK